MKRIRHFDWRTELKSLDRGDIASIGEDLILADNIIIPSIFRYPLKVDMVSALICVKGMVRRKINMKSFEIKSSEMLIILADQILELEYISDDFEGLNIYMSKEFLMSLNVAEGLSTYISIYDTPCITLSPRELEAMQMYYSLTKSMIRANDNPYRIEIARHLTKAFFYGMGYYLHKVENREEVNRNKMLVDSFTQLMQAHFKEHRGLEFYADKLYLTPKYMSTVIKEASGKSAGEWIDERVILEARVFLKSTNLTIQQISEELNFPSQSSFGKYFKRLVGVSPKEYRNS